MPILHRNSNKFGFSNPIRPFLLQKFLGKYVQNNRINWVSTALCLLWWAAPLWNPAILAVQPPNAPAPRTFFIEVRTSEHHFYMMNDVKPSAKWCGHISSIYYIVIPKEHISSYHHISANPWQDFFEKGGSNWWSIDFLQYDYFNQSVQGNGCLVMSCIWPLKGLRRLRLYVKWQSAAGFKKCYQIENWIRISSAVYPASFLGCEIEWKVAAFYVEQNGFQFKKS